MSRPARSADPTLLADRRARLLIRATAGTQEPAGSFTIDVAGARGGPVASQLTDKSGRTSFALDPGEYLVTARTVGLVPQRLAIVATAGYADTIVFTLGQP